MALLAFPAWTHARDPDTAQEGEPETAQELDAVMVTGSHIRRIAVEGPLPISTLTREELLDRGEPSVADAIRDLPFNSFGSTADIPNSDFPNLALPNLRGIGSKYTLSLLDGHRLPGFAIADGGASASLSGIPLAAIERIEVLRDGASAIYGSDAIGGVINLLTRRADTPPELELQLEHPQQDGGASQRASFTFGRSHARGHWLLAVEAQDRDVLLGADRDYLIAEAAFFPTGNPGSYRRRNPVSGAPVGFFEADARCPQAVDSDPLFPSSTRLRFGNNEICGYRVRDLNAERAGFEGRSAFASASHALTEALRGYARVLAVHGDSRTQLAPSPAGNLGIAADNPHNPTLGERGPGLGFPLQLQYRLTALGPRITDVSERSLHLLLGLDAALDWADGGDWRLGISHNRYDHDSLGVAGYASLVAFQAALDSARFNPFAALPGDLTGLEDTRYQPRRSSQTRSSGLDVAWTVDGGLAFDLAANYAFGLDLRRDEYAIDPDPLTIAGGVVGTGASSPAQSAARSYAGVYGELFVPLHDRLELGVAARYDRYQDAGGALSPKLALGFRPRPEWLLRGALGKGFQAPDLASAYGATATSDGSVVDEIACAQQPQDPLACEGVPVEVRSVPNPQLRPEYSRQASLGLVWQPGAGFELVLDAFRTRISDRIGALFAEHAMLLELDCLQSGRACDPILDGQVIRDAFGNPATVVLPSINIARIDTRGVDLELVARRATRLGEFRLDLRASKILAQRFDPSPFLEESDIVGAFGAPAWRGNLRIAWEHGAHAVSGGVEYIASRGDCAPARFADGSRNPECEARIGSYAELHAQWRWRTPWGADLAFGGRNLGNRPPPHDVFGNYQYGLYDPNGRLWYLRYRQAWN